MNRCFFIVGIIALCGCGDSVNVLPGPAVNTRAPEAQPAFVVQPDSTIKIGWGADTQSAIPILILDLKVKNVTDKPASSVNGYARYYAEGRSIPTVEERFSYAFIGGLEPGETKPVQSQISTEMNASWHHIPGGFAQTAPGKWSVSLEGGLDYDITLSPSE